MPPAKGRSEVKCIYALVVALVLSSAVLGCGSSHGGGGGTPITSGLSITSASPLASAQSNAAYTNTLAAQGGTGVYTWSITAGALPAGLTLSPSGTISGTPASSGTSNFTVRVTDSGSATAQQSFALLVTVPVTISPATLSTAKTGTAYNQQLAASGGGGGPYTFSINAGTLPPGLALSSSGLLSGTPTLAGSYNFTVRATSTDTTAGLQGYALTVQ